MLTVLAMAKNILSSGVLPSSPQFGGVTASELVPDEDRPRVVTVRREEREREREREGGRGRHGVSKRLSSSVKKASISLSFDYLIQTFQSLIS